jgi:regulator of replication initiation timing
MDDKKDFASWDEDQYKFYKKKKIFVIERYKGLVEQWYKTHGFKEFEVHLTIKGLKKNKSPKPPKVIKPVVITHEDNKTIDECDMALDDAPRTRDVGVQTETNFILDLERKCRQLERTIFNNQLSFDLSHPTEVPSFTPLDQKESNSEIEKLKTDIANLKQENNMSKIKIAELSQTISDMPTPTKVIKENKKKDFLNIISRLKTLYNDVRPDNCEERMVEFQKIYPELLTMYESKSVILLHGALERCFTCCHRIFLDSVNRTARLMSILKKNGIPYD